MEGASSPLRRPSDGASASPANSTKVQLKRELGLFSAVSLIVGVMIGSGIFVSPTSALERSGSVGLALTVWALCGLISFLGALCFAELGGLIPESGAEYAYLQRTWGGGTGRKAWGSLPAFLCSWVYVLLLRPAEVAVVTLTFAQYALPVIPGLSQGYKSNLDKLVALIALGVMTAINFLSVKLYVKVQNLCTTCKLAVCALVIGGGIYEIAHGNTGRLNSGFKGSTSSPGQLALAFYSGLWAYDGWNMVTTVTEEVKNPEKLYVYKDWYLLLASCNSTWFYCKSVDIKAVNFLQIKRVLCLACAPIRNIVRSVALGVPLVTVVYILMNVAYMTVLDVTDMVNSPAVAVEFGARVLGPLGIFVPIGVAISTFGCALSIQFTVTRLCYVSGREGHMMQVLSFVHVRRLTPAPAVALQGILASAFILAGNIEALIDFVSFLVWIFYGLAMVALITLRRTHPDAKRPYQVPIIFPILVINVALFLSLLPIITDPSPRYLLGVLFMSIGTFVFWLCVIRKQQPKCSGKVSRGVQLLLEVVPPDKEK